MTLEHACNIILEYSHTNQIDELTGIERMVKYFRTLTVNQRRAIEIFMEETKK